jgi:hypothetical protein
MAYRTLKLNAGTPGKTSVGKKIIIHKKEKKDSKKA